VTEPGTGAKRIVRVTGNGAATPALLTAALNARVALMAGVTLKASVTSPSTPVPAAAGNVIFQDAVFSVKSAADAEVTTSLTLTNLPTSYVSPTKPGFVDLTVAGLTTWLNAYNAATGRDWQFVEGIYVIS